MGRFLVSLTTQERRKRAWRVIEFYKSGLYPNLPEEVLDASYDYITSASKEPNSDSDHRTLEAVTGLYFVAEVSITIVNFIRMTASLPPKSRKDKLAQLVHAQFHDKLNHFTPEWTHFMCKMEAIDFLSAPDMFGDAVVGLVLLFPCKFSWSKRGTFGGDTDDEMQRAVRDAIKNLPELARELAPYATKIGADMKRPPLPRGPNPALSSWPLEIPIPQSEEGIVAYPPHPPPTARDVFEVGLGHSSVRTEFEVGHGTNTLHRPGAAFPIVSNTPSQSKPTAMNIASLLS